MKLGILLLSLSLGVVLSSSSVEGSTHDFGLTLGMTETQVQDKVLNNIRHRGLFASADLFYQTTTETSRQRLGLLLNPGLLASRYDPDRSSIVIDMSLNYQVARKVRDVGSSYHLFLGGLTGADFYSTYYKNWDDSHVYWLTAYGLGPVGRLEYQRSTRSSLWLEMSLPVLALVSRPPARFLYKVVNPNFPWMVGKFHENLRLTSVHEHFAPHISLGYTFRSSGGLATRLFWSFRYVHTNREDSKDIRILNHTLGAALLF